MMTNYRMIKATQGHMDEVAKVFKRSFRATYPNLTELHTAEEDREFFINVVFVKNSIYLVEAKKSSAILGFIAFHHEWIDHLYIDIDCQKRGIGSELVALAKRESDKLQLWTFQENMGARAFYKKHGFVEIKMTDGQGNEEKKADVLLEWVRGDE